MSNELKVNATEFESIDTYHFNALAVTREFKLRLLAKISRIASIVNIQHGEVVKIISTHASSGDNAVLTALVKKAKRGKDNPNGAAKRAAYRAHEFTKVFQGVYSKLVKTRTNYLDVGAGDGSVTLATGKLLGLKPESIYGVDIPEWGTNTHTQSQKFNYDFIESDNPILPHKTGLFDCVSVLQTLHHVPHLTTIMLELNRVMAIGGILILREHDCDSKNMERLIDLEHIMYDVVVDGADISSWRESYYGRYRAKKWWVSLFEVYQFKHIPIRQVMKANNTNIYYAMYQKIGNAKPMESYSAEVMGEMYKDLFHGDQPPSMDAADMSKFITRNI